MEVAMPFGFGMTKRTPISVRKEQERKKLRDRLFAEQIERAETAFNAALGAEARNNPSAAQHFLQLAIREEEKALNNV
jgi:hypothetical protein